MAERDEKTPDYMHLLGSLRWVRAVLRRSPSMEELGADTVEIQQEIDQLFSEVVAAMRPVLQPWREERRKRGQ